MIIILIMEGILQKKNKIYLFDSYINLLNEVDAVCIVTPTITHYSLAMEAINNNKHVFIEKPICSSIHDTNQIIKTKNKFNRIVQVGHIERFNPAFLKIKNSISNPMYINAERVCPFTNRSSDISVILDLMIHDIDLMLSFTKYKIKDVFAKGLKVFSKNIDMAIAQVLFVNGTVAWLKASRIGTKKYRKFRLIDENNYYSIDLLNHKLNSNSINFNKQLYSKKYLVPKNDALKLELEHFANSIFNQTNPETSVESALEALKCIKLIEKQVYENY